jgi:hypothetical protein
MPQSIPNMAQMLTLIGDVLPFIRKRVGPENGLSEGGGKMMPYPGGSGVVNMTGAPRQPGNPAPLATESPLKAYQDYVRRNGSPPPNEWKANMERAMQTRQEVPREVRIRERLREEGYSDDKISYAIALMKQTGELR